MPSYYGIVDRGGEGFGIWFPDLPGCTSGGRTMEELSDNATEAIALWIEAAVLNGDMLPNARTLDQLRQDAHVLQALTEDEGASFIEVRLQ